MANEYLQSGMRHLIKSNGALYAEEVQGSFTKRTKIVLEPEFVDGVWDIYMSETGQQASLQCFLGTMHLALENADKENKT